MSSISAIGCSIERPGLERIIEKKVWAKHIHANFFRESYYKDTIFSFSFQFSSSCQTSQAFYNKLQCGYRRYGRVEFASHRANAIWSNITTERTEDTLALCDNPNDLDLHSSK